MSDAEYKPLSRSEINKLSGEAQVAFCLDKQPTYEVALARAIEAATAAKYAERIAELERLHKQACDMYMMKNRSGCVCKIDPDTDELLSPCGLHDEWLSEKTADLQAKLDAAAAVDAELVSYILQDDIQNRLTPRVVDIAYSAFMIGRSGKNKDDGGPCDWFNDTRPMVLEQLEKIRKELSIDAMRTGEPKP